MTNDIHGRDQHDAKSREIRWLFWQMFLHKEQKYSTKTKQNKKTSKMYLALWKSILYVYRVYEIKTMTNTHLILTTLISQGMTRNLVLEFIYQVQHVANLFIELELELERCLFDKVQENVRWAQQYNG